MNDMQFGRLSGRHLHLRWLSPWAFRAWTKDMSYEFSWREMLSLRNWWRAIRDPLSWRLWFRRWPGMNHRCYCPAGVMVDGECVLCGFGLIFWYSEFAGKLPCLCDIIMAQQFGCSDCGAEPVIEGSTLCAECTEAYAEPMKKNDAELRRV